MTKQDMVTKLMNIKAELWLHQQQIIENKTNITHDMFVHRMRRNARRLKDTEQLVTEIMKG